jgi:hypothetical protein
MDIPNEFLILDSRRKQDMNKFTFTNKCKKDIIKTFYNSLLNRNNEYSIQIVIEMLISGQITDILKIILKIILETIEPKYNKVIEIYFAEIDKINQCDLLLAKKEKIEIRNNSSVRNSVLFLTSIICNYPKCENSFNNFKISKEDFTLHNMTDKLRAKNSLHLYELKPYNWELELVKNEFTIQLRKNNINACIYWFEWLLFYIQQKEKSNVETKTEQDYFEYSSKYPNHWIWIFWKICISYSKKINQFNICKEFVYYYSNKFTPTRIKTLKNILYYCISLLCRETNFQNNIFDIDDKNIMNEVLQIILRKNFLFQNFQLQNPNDFDKEDINEFKNTTVNQEIIKKQKKHEIDSKMAILDKFDYFIEKNNYTKKQNFNEEKSNNYEIKKIRIPSNKLNSNIIDNTKGVKQNITKKNITNENESKQNTNNILLSNTFKIPNINSCLSNIKKVKTFQNKILNQNDKVKNNLDKSINDSKIKNYDENKFDSEIKVIKLT